MNTSRLIIGVLSAFAASASLRAQATANTSAANTDTSGDTVTLPEFTVSANTTNPYRATDSLSAARIRGALIDTPATVNVITGDFLKDIGAGSLYDATQYISGIGNGRLAGGSGILDRQTIRGYENDGRTIDNFNSSFQANLDPLIYERVEIVKGPNAILAPTGTPGGAINVLTKSPLFTQQNTATVELGDFFANQITFDSTGPLPFDKRMAYRIIAGYQDADSFVPGSIKHFTLDPQFTFRISEKSQITFKLISADWKTWGAASNPSITLHAGPEVANGATIGDPATGFDYGAANGAPSWMVRADRVLRGTVEFTTALSDRVSMRLAAMRHYDHFWNDFTQLAVPGQSNQGSRYNPYTGIYTPNYVWSKDSSGNYVSTFSAQYDPTSIPVTAGMQKTFNNDMQIQNDYAGHFALNGVSIEPVAGFSVQRTTSSTRSYNAVAGQIPNLNLLAPDIDVPHPTLYTLAQDQLQITRKRQVYGFTKLGFLDNRLFLTGGISRIRIDVPVTNRISGSTSRITGSKNTPMAGALYKITKELSAYYSYSKNANAVSFNNQALFQEGKQHEFGVKSEFFDQRLSISAAHFQIAQSNIVTPNPSYFLDPVNNPQFLKADLTNHGFEMDVVGGITKDLSVIASATKMQLRDAFGRRQRNIPDETINGMLKYDFHTGPMKGASFFVSATHVGNTAGENPSTAATALGVVEQVSFYVPDRTIFNLGGSYKWSRYRFNLNIDNVLDKKTIWEPSGRYSLAPYPGINYRLTTTIQF